MLTKFIKFMLKLALPVVILCVLFMFLRETLEWQIFDEYFGGILTIVVVLIITIALVARMIKVKKNAKKYYKEWQRIVRQELIGSTSWGPSIDFSSLSNNEIIALRKELDDLASKYSRRHEIYGGKLEVDVTSDGHGGFLISTEEIKFDYWVNADEVAKVKDSANETISNIQSAIESELGSILRRWGVTVKKK